MEVMPGKAIDTLSSRTFLNTRRLDPRFVRLAQAVRFVVHAQARSFRIPTSKRS
jgi:hypothetical protein